MAAFGRIVLRWVLGVTAAAIVAYCCYALVEFAPKDERFQVPFAAIEFTATPSYVPHDFLSQVRTATQLPDLLDTRAPELARLVERAFGRHPWVASVQRVVVQPPRRIQVQVQYRVPAAVVIIGPDHFLIDQNSYLLPRGPETAGVEASLLLIHGLAAPPLVKPGQRYELADLIPAAHLAGLVSSKRERWNLAAIEVGSDPVQPDLRLRTKQGTIIVWESLGDGSPAENSRSRGNETLAAEKIRRLEAYCAQYGSLEAPDGPYALDVRPSTGLLRRRIP
jgi:hypothetical protein